VNERPRKPAPFSGGELVFHRSHVQLCGVMIITDAGFGQSMKLLEELRKKLPDGQFMPRRGEDLAAAVDADNGISTITSCMFHLRRNITARLLERRNIRCEKFDVIDHNEQGYFLRNWITVRSAEVEDADGDQPASSANADLNSRQRWVLGQLSQGVRLRRSMLDKQFSISPKTAKRDLKELVSQGLIQYVRRPSPGYYRFVK